MPKRNKVWLWKTIEGKLIPYSRLKRSHLRNIMIHLMLRSQGRSVASNALLSVHTDTPKVKLQRVGEVYWSVMSQPIPRDWYGDFMAANPGQIKQLIKVARKQKVPYTNGLKLLAELRDEALRQVRKQERASA